ncbi:RelA/SpoT domain-containing protein [Arcanobacterium pinnipediorum]|uniref:RelA/SpoT domain-containing protein n=1 Tax=Arcanobacterium pinnipediorum TaxID=1503041 RepID=A0ABY5AIA0_9ACTO|nr:RelA/SpoT domain-containing protein [Arcanobacterium pinnipediorum]USR79171.1 RelA/SpoT domain-containing protein [Arcanobacterium pinnipediorum]
MKRVKSIVHKIQRPHGNFELSTLDDVGGCRLIVNSLEDAEKAKKFLVKQLNITDPRQTKDYIEKPKPDGYRSCHLLTRRESNGTKYRVEIQIRTKLQHYWATAIEVFDELYGTSIKSPNNTEAGHEEAPKDLPESLAIVSQLFTLEEDLSAGDKVPKSKEELLQELATMAKFRSAIDDMEDACSDVLESADENKVDSSIFILSFSKDDQFLSVQPYTSEQLDKALETYAQLEQDIESNGHSPTNVVLVHAKGMQELRLAYPNYSANAPDFIKKVRQYFALAEKF